MFFQSLTKEELSDFLQIPSQNIRAAKLNQEQRNRRSHRWARQIFQWAYQKFALDWDSMSDLPQELREYLKHRLPFYTLHQKTFLQSKDGTHKYLWECHDGYTIESVMIPAADLDEVFEEKVHFTKEHRYRGIPVTFDAVKAWKRKTACISSQVGCAMKCSFCLTGKQGLQRNLEVHEIVQQIVGIKRTFDLSNIVFMGMGEPLHNFHNVVKACKILLDQDGCNFSKRKITISTSGLVDKIEKLSQVLDVSLAISLNATTDSTRSKIMPVNRAYPIEKLLDACKNYANTCGRRITFEYVLLQGINDRHEDAQRLTKLLQNIPSKINLIPFNPHHGADYQRPSDDHVKQFQKILLDKGFTATVRISRGQDILAACGQLQSKVATQMFALS